MPTRRGDITRVAWLGAVKPFIGRRKSERWRKKPHKRPPLKSGTKMHVHCADMLHGLTNHVKGELSYLSSQPQICSGGPNQTSPSMW